MPSTSSKPSKASKPTSKASKSNSDSQPASQTTNQPTNLPCLTRASASVAMNLLANYPLLQTTTPRASHTGREGREGGRKGGGQKVVLNLLKIGSVQVETPKSPRPCTLACNCKIIWVSDSGQVGEWSSKFQNPTAREAFEKIMLNLIFFQGNLF